MLEKLIDCAMIIVFVGLGILCLVVAYEVIKNPGSINTKYVVMRDR